MFYIIVKIQIKSYEKAANRVYCGTEMSFTG